MDFEKPLNLGNRKSTGKQNFANLLLKICKNRASKVSLNLNEVESFGTTPPSEVRLTNADVLTVTEIYIYIYI